MHASYSHLQEESWHPMLQPLVDLSSALRKFCRDPSDEHWRVVPELWRKAAKLQGDLTKVQADSEMLFMLPAESRQTISCEASSSVYLSELAYHTDIGGEFPPPKVATEFLGKKCDVVDASAWKAIPLGEESFLKQYFDPTAQKPIVMRGLANLIFPAGRTWDFDMLVENCGDVIMHARRADDGTTRFGYANDMPDSCYIDDSLSRVQHDLMSLQEIVGRIRACGREGSSLYLWAPLLQGEETAGAFTGRSSEMAFKLMSKGVETIQWNELNALGSLGGFGSIFSAQLFVSGVHAVTKCHYDSSQNIFLQVQGAKRFLLFPPLIGAQAFAPFPAKHPRNRHARAELHEPDYAQWPSLRIAHAGAVEAILGPGDALFLPYGWWHHVESLLTENVSINFWFRGGLLSNRPPQQVLRPLPDPLLVVLVREIEYVVAGLIGEQMIGPFLLWLQAATAVCYKGLPPAGMELVWLRCANYVLIRLAELLEPEKLQSVLNALGDGRRFLGLCFQEDKELLHTPASHQVASAVESRLHMTLCRAHLSRSGNSFSCMLAGKRR